MASLALSHVGGVVVLTLLSMRTLESLIENIVMAGCWGFDCTLDRKRGQTSCSLRSSPTPLLCFPAFLSATVYGDAVVFMRPRLHCKGETCQSLLEMKALDLSAHPLSAYCRSPVSVGAVANEGANGLSPRRHYGVFI